MVLGCQETITGGPCREGETRTVRLEASRAKEITYLAALLAYLVVCWLAGVLGSYQSGCHTVNTMVLGCQGPGYLVSPQTLVSQDCTVGGLAREGNYLLGCLASLEPSHLAAIQ